MCIVRLNHSDVYQLSCEGEDFCGDKVEPYYNFGKSL